MPDSRHSELIATLTELYTLLHNLAAIPENSLRLPDAETGLHPPNSINSIAARDAGYQEEAISLMYALPYLDVGTHDWSVQLLPSTYVTTYLGADLDDGDFESQREVLQDEVMPSTALRLTWSEVGYGIVFIYDTRTKLMTPWKPIDNPDEVNDYFHVPAASPREILGPLIKDYRSLHYLGTPDGIDHNHELFSESGGVPPRDWGEADRRRWKAQYDVWKATRKLRDIYLECGWDVDAVVQTQFRTGEFMERRAHYWEEVVEPLRTIEQAVE